MTPGATEVGNKVFYYYGSNRQILEPGGCLTRDFCRLGGLDELLAFWRGWARMPGGKRGGLSVGGMLSDPTWDSVTAGVLGHDMERTGGLLPNFLWPGVPPAEWGNRLKLLTRKTEWSLEGKARPSEQFPCSPGVVGFGEQSCVWLFLTSTWRRLVFKCWPGRQQPRQARWT